MIKIISYNVNGIRSAIRKDICGWLKKEQPDIISFQELKAFSTQFDASIFESLGYSCYWFSSERPGYSGVGILTKKEPNRVTYGMGNKTHDYEGRVLILDYSDFSVVSVYMPSGSTGEVRQNYKMEFLEDFYFFIQKKLKTNKNIIISGDFNICHKSIDIHNPVANKNSSGFLPEERDWLTSFLELGLLDSFRFFNSSPDKYSWWTYRFNARKKNLGWRIDYNIVSENLKKRLINASIMSDVVHSDHCPVSVELV